MRSMLVVMSLMLTCAAASWSDGPFYRTAAGKWLPVRSVVGGDTVRFSLSPADIGGSQTVVVLSRPAWMVLEDDQAPQITRLIVDG